MQAAGVEAVLAVQARSCAGETDCLLKLAQTNARIVGVVGWTDLCATNVQETLDSYASHALLKGFRHILQDEPHLPSLMRSPYFNFGVAAVQKRGWVYDVLVFDQQISGVVDFCARHDNHWLVLDHVGKPCIRDWERKSEVPGRWLAGMRALASMPHVVCKLSGLVTETDWATGRGLMPEDAKIMLECFDRALELFGPNRIMYGSDWPVCQLAAPYEVVHELAQRWANSRLTALEQNAFWSGNAVRCYGLTIPTAA
jgi:L-fuconolactonase